MTELKQQWALDILKRFDFEIEIKNKASSKFHQILVGNHVSYLDIIILLAVHPEAVFLSKKEVAGWPLIGSAAKKIGTLFVDRDCTQSRAKARTQIETIFRTARKPVHLAGFPSGTTCLTESKPWKKGLFEIAQQNNIEVQPFRITYEPLRECAYVDDDNLFLSLTKLFKTPNKKIAFEWGTTFQVKNLEQQIPQIQNWCKPFSSKHKAIEYEEKVFSRPAHSFQLQ